MRAIVLLVLLAGCASSTYTRLGASTYDLYEDRYWCQHDTRGDSAAAKSAAIDKCMASKGWAVQ